MHRRTLMVLGAAFSATAFAPLAAAQQWPSVPVRIVVPYGAGGGTTDPLARMLAEELSKQLGATFLVENKPGANGNIGAVHVKGATPDGHVLLFTGAGTLATNPALYKNIGFHPQRDFEPVVVVGNVPNILVVNPAVPANSVKEFVEHLRRSPGKLSVGSTGIGSSMHIASELFRQTTQTSMVHVPYNGAGPATTDLLSGNVQAMFQLVPGIAEHVKSKKVKALAVMASKRSPTLPDVPTMAEAGFPDLESSTWLAFVAPKGTPKAVVDRLNEAVNKLLAQPEFRERVVRMGVEPMGGTSVEFTRFLDTEIKKWGEVVRRSGAVVD
ncbi:MAG: tripartite tricarboxylate transporter substrate binding protein [Ideonella sp.]|nr:tripartite tricarboxylate transporter substrate binding protein [Ideonella sp.]MCC7458087.1 tripartite tricarboxylate transporter substrate binding protein [Nitrospira sp.]